MKEKGERKKKNESPRLCNERNFKKKKRKKKKEKGKKKYKDIPRLNPRDGNSNASICACAIGNWRAVYAQKRKSSRRFLNHAIGNSKR